MMQHDEVIVSIGHIVYARGGRLLCLAVGSCVALSLRNEDTGQCGLAHIFLPAAPPGDKSPEMPAKYADTAIDAMLAHLLPPGQPPQTLRASFAGGARMFPIRQTDNMADIGARNVLSVRERLTALGIPVDFCDVGGSRARTVLCDVSSGDMRIRRRNG